MPLEISLSLWVSFLPCLLPCESAASPEQKTLPLTGYAHAVCYFEESSALATLTAFISLQNAPCALSLSIQFFQRLSFVWDSREKGREFRNML